MFKVTREHAILRGMKKYFTGRACLRQHICQRHVTSRRCVECQHEDVIDKLLSRPTPPTRPCPLMAARGRAWGMPTFRQQRQSMS